MATTVVFDVIDALVTQAGAAITTARVSDGFEVTSDPGNFLMIGVEDPDLEGAALAADVKQEWLYVGTTERKETGQITCAALAWNGEGNAKKARDDVEAMLAALETVLRAGTGYTLGIATLVWAEFGTALQLSQAQDENGAMALVTFRIKYEAQI